MIATQRGWKIILSAVSCGLLLGIVARLWMRWISTEPEFSWSGTIFIVIAFTIITTTQAVVYVLRRRIKSRGLTSVVRGGGVILSLPIFMGAGMIMFPPVVLASIALWQKKMDRRIRFVLVIISLIIPILQIIEIGTNFGWNFPTLGRSLLFILIYSIVIILLQPTVSPFVSFDARVVPAPQFKSLLIVVLIVLVAMLLLFFTMGISRS